MNDVLTISTIFFIAALTFVVAFFVLKTTIKNRDFTKIIGYFTGWLTFLIAFCIFIAAIAHIPYPRLKGIGLIPEPQSHKGCVIDKSMFEEGGKG